MSESLLVAPKNPQSKFSENEISELLRSLLVSDVGPLIQNGRIKIKFSESQGWRFVLQADLAVSR